MVEFIGLTTKLLFEILSTVTSSVNVNEVPSQLLYVICAVYVFGKVEGQTLIELLLDMVVAPSSHEIE